MDGAEDADLLLRLSEKGKILNLNQPLLDYRIHPTQESFRWRPRHAAVQELAFRAALSRRRTKAIRWTTRQRSPSSLSVGVWQRPAMCGAGHF